MKSLYFDIVEKNLLKKRSKFDDSKEGKKNQMYFNYYKFSKLFNITFEQLKNAKETDCLSNQRRTEQKVLRIYYPIFNFIEEHDLYCKGRTRNASVKYLPQ